MSVKRSFSERLRLAWQVLSGSASPLTPTSTSSPAAEPPPRLVEAEPNAALQLLGLLQRQGRLVDFLQEDISGFSDADVGNAARVVHQGCREALREHLKLQPISERQEGERVTLEAGFDAAGYRLSGKLSGEPPFVGTLRHRGWRAAELNLPKLAPGHDLSVLAPAEVEL